MYVLLRSHKSLGTRCCRVCGWREKERKIYYRLLKLKLRERDRDIPHTEAWSRPAYNNESRRRKQFIPFSAFWLRSSVVSVLISLISDTWPIRPHDINLISFMGAAPSLRQLAVSGSCVRRLGLALTLRSHRRTPLSNHTKKSSSWREKNNESLQISPVIKTFIFEDTELFSQLGQISPVCWDVHFEDYELVGHWVWMRWWM